MSRLLLMDGHSVAYRAFYALPVENFSTSTGQHTNAVYGFTAMLINVLRDEAPTHVAVAFDKSRQTFRTQEYAEYKAGRASTPDEFKGQVDLVKEVLDALRIQHLEVEGYEADDIIATLTSQAREEGMEVVILSGDRDALQLVDERTLLLYPVRGVSETWRLTPEAVTEKYLVPPHLYSDLAALVGESSDNLPGVPGVGPKTATAVIAAVGDGKDFDNGRHMAAWLGLVPRQHSSGDRTILMGISKRGDQHLRTLLVHGARAVVRTAAGKSDRFSQWVNELRERRGTNRAIVAVANKNARIIWALLARNEEYRPVI